MDRLRVGRAIAHMNWLRRGLRTRILRIIVPREFDSAAAFEVDYHGYRYRGYLTNWLDQNLYLFGGYEEEVQEVLGWLQLTGRSGVFVDVGANVGVHSLFASRLFQRVHAFEPFPFVRSKLTELLERNHIENVTVHDVALGASDAKVPFFAPPGANYGTGSFVSDYSSSNTPYGELSVVRGDKYFRERVGAVDVIKIDVEGYEIEVLQGLRETLRSCRPDVIVELSDMTWRRLGDVAGLLKLLPDGYEVFDIQSREVFAWLFERPAARLKPVGVRRPNDNVLAIGNERVQKLRLAGLLAA